MTSIDKAIDAIREKILDTEDPPRDTLERATWRVDIIIRAMYDAYEDKETAVRDILTDLIHFCEVNDVNLEGELPRAWAMADEEHAEWNLPAPAEEPATPKVTTEDRDREVQLREQAEQIGLEVIGNIDLGDGVQRTPVAFTEAIRSGWIGAETVSHVVTAAAYKGLKAVTA